MRCLFALALALLPALAAADIIHMADGTTREGKVIESNDKEVVVDFGQGGVSLRLTLPRSDVVRVEQKATPNDLMTVEYVRRLSKALEGDADAWYGLGVWCQQQRVMKGKAQEAFQRALALDPNHVPTRQALGHVMLNGEWMTRDRAIQVLAPELAGAVDPAELLAEQKKLAEAQTDLLKAQKQLAELEGRVTDLTKQNQDLRVRLATPPPPPPPQVIYRPFIIYRDRPRQGPPDGPKGGDTPPSPGTPPQPDRRTNKVSP